MGLRRGQVWRTDFGLPRGSAPALVRPALVVSADTYNDSGIRTAVVAPITSNLQRALIPGNVLLPADTCGLTEDSVVNVTQITTADRVWLEEELGVAPDWLMAQVDAGLRLALDLR